MYFLLCSHNGQLEGAPFHLLRLAEFLNAREHTCFFATPEKGKLAPIAKKKNVEYIVEPSLFSRDDPVRSCKRALLRSTPEVIIINTIFGDQLVKHFKAIAPEIPIIWIILESERQHYSETLPQYSEEAFGLADRVVFVSDATRDVYNDLDRGNFATIHDGLDLSDIDAYLSTISRQKLKEKYHLPIDTPIITMIGTTCPRKGQREFVEAALSLLQKEPKAHFLLVGKTWPGQWKYMRDIRNRIQDAGAREHFSIFPETKEIYDFFALSDIFVSNSYIEAFPIVILEAMAFSLPIIAAECYGVVEQVSHEHNGLLILPGNTTQLRDAMLRYLENPEYANTLGTASRKRIEEEFTDSHVSDAYLNVCETMLHH